MRSGIRSTVSFVLIAALLITPAAIAIDVSLAPEYVGDPIEIVQPVASGSDRDTYTGTMRIFMSEPVSRYLDNQTRPYEFGFLDFAVVQGLSINTGEVYTHEVTWDASNSGFTGVDPDNIMAQVALYDPTPHTAYSVPPSGSPFFAYYVDAAAQATPGVPGQNVSNPDFTHTVFIEEATRRG